MRQSDTESRDRYNALVNQYTARELATMLAATERLFKDERELSTKQAVALREIASGHWNKDGAVRIAREALER